MAAQDADAGIRCSLSALPAARFWEVWDEAPLAFVEWAPRPLGFMLLDLTMRSGMPWNTTGFSDSEIDALLAEVEAEIDVEARRPLMGRLQARMQDVGPIVQPSRSEAHTSELQSIMRRPYAV